MRTMVLLVLLFVVGGEASAQQLPVAPTPEPEADGESHSVSPTGRVVVATAGGETIRGTLLCLSENKVELLRDGRTLQIPLDTVRRIRTPADPVWDGGLKGAVIPLILWAVLCHDCGAEPFLRASLTYGAIGLATDAINTNRRTLYRRHHRSLGVGWGFSF